MRDGKTSRLKTAGPTGGFAAFARRHEAKLVAVSGKMAGVECPLEGERTVLGRGPGVDVAFDDQAMSRQHAVLEFCGDGFVVRDLGSTNGLLVNDQPEQESLLSDGDCLEIGTHRFRLTLIEREDAPNTYILSADD